MENQDIAWLFVDIVLILTFGYSLAIYFPMLPKSYSSSKAI
jgi:hypothetical protein